MKYSVRKYLLEAEKKKEQLKKDSHIVEKRLSMSSNISELISEVSYLNKQKYDKKIINENLLDVLSVMFKEDGQKFMETVKTKLGDFLINKLQYQGFEQEVLLKAIGDTELDDVPKLFTDCRFLASKLAEVYTEDFSGAYLNDMPDFMKDKMTNFVSDSQTKKQLEDSFVDKLCPMMGDINSKMELKLKDIRDNILS
jgi:hypothetical protein